MRFAGLERLPFPLWHDELLVLRPAMALQGNPADFRDTVRTILDDAGRPSGTVGVVYLEVFRAALRTFGTTVFGVRFLSALGGVLSLCTAMLLGRALLPRGGGTLAGLILAGLRWHLILSRWAWVLLFVVPILDIATLLARAPAGGAALADAALAGAVAGVGAHVYLSAWIAAAVLGLVLLWPAEVPLRRTALALSFSAAFAAAVLPLFLFHSGGRPPYPCARATTTSLVEMRRTRSVDVPGACAPSDRAARALGAAGPKPDERSVRSAASPVPARRRARAGVLRAVGAAPRGPLRCPAAHAGMAPAFLASVAWGERMSPNGSRFAYLTTVLAVGAAAGPAVARRDAAPGLAPARRDRAVRRAVRLPGGRDREPRGLGRAAADVHRLRRPAHVRGPGGRAVGALRRRRASSRARSTAFCRWTRSAATASFRAGKRRGPFRPGPGNVSSGSRCPRPGPGPASAGSNGCATPRGRPGRS